MSQTHHVDDLWDQPPLFRPSRETWLSIVANVRHERVVPTDAPRVLRAMPSEAQGGEFHFRAALLADARTRVVGPLLCEFSARLLRVMQPDQVRALIAEADALADARSTIDKERYMQLLSEAAPDSSEQSLLRASSLLRAFKRRWELLADSLSEGEVRELLAEHAGALELWTRPPRRILLVEDFGERRYPRFQFDPTAVDGLLPGLSVVLDALGRVPELQQLAWFLTPQEPLHRTTPSDALRDGAVEEVRLAACFFAYSHSPDAESTG